MKISSTKPALFCVAALGLFALTLGACTADLRTARLDEGALAPTRTHKGRALLTELGDRYGAAAWRRSTTTEVVFRDDWDSVLVAMMGMEPWDEEDLIRFRFRTGTFDIRADFMDGPRKGEVQGLQAWQTYAQAPDEAAPRFEEDDDVRFMLPAIVYLSELPFRLANAELVTYEGEAALDGRPHDRVFATWGGLEAHTGADQYLLWIDRASGQLTRADYTVREAARILDATVWYGDLRQVGGVTVPHRLTITDRGVAPAEGYLHQVRVQSFALDSFPEGVLYPRAGLARVGDAKPAEG